CASLNCLRDSGTGGRELFSAHRAHPAASADKTPYPYVQERDIDISNRRPSTRHQVAYSVDRYRTHSSCRSRSGQRSDVIRLLLRSRWAYNRQAARKTASKSLNAIVLFFST